MGDRNEKQKYRESVKIENVEFGKREEGTPEKRGEEQFFPTPNQIPAG